MTEPAEITPDDKDWTVVIGDGCKECGYEPHDVRTTGDRLRASIPRWQERLAHLDAQRRPDPTTWSPVEYAAHVRDVCRIFRERLALMLDEDNPTFDNWDQDAAAVEQDYFHQQPATVASEYAAQATQTADAFDAVRDDQWQRTSKRSNGASFTTESFAVYFLHDIEHHLHDVGA
ncbi:DinB family protein [Cumulibacter manganitolerans]|uniref:DinB family protein n=1 Tax=Cumulibacter manganitolerans TaxID=1884992 RepID=UPI001294F29A|nr:DinB family protein [Cumulibacter manganitolerans]